jgi:hypothetical protein
MGVIKSEHSLRSTKLGQIKLLECCAFFPSRERINGPNCPQLA